MILIHDQFRDGGKCLRFFDFSTQEHFFMLPGLYGAVSNTKIRKVILTDRVLKRKIVNYSLEVQNGLI